MRSQNLKNSKVFNSDISLELRRVVAGSLKLFVGLFFKLSKFSNHSTIIVKVLEEIESIECQP